MCSLPHSLAPFPVQPWVSVEHVSHTCKGIVYGFQLSLFRGERALKGDNYFLHWNMVHILHHLFLNLLRDSEVFLNNLGKIVFIMEEG